MASEFPGQVSAPPREPKGDAPLGEKYAWREKRHRQSSTRIWVEHTNAEHKQWRPLQRYIGRREYCPEIHRAVAGLVSDRASRRAAKQRTSTELVRAAAC
ncbi:transposase [Streptomyces acidicola]|uniref:transposase n=1 Tax=Streptomyces acidicola TaxID=2596892 RepID=UPI00379A0C5D